MFCKKCGSAIPEGALFCADCGTKVETTPEIPVEETAVVTEPVAQAAFVEPDFDAAPRRKKKILPALIAIVAVLAAAAVAVVLFFDVLKGFFLKTVGNEEDYFKYVELNALRGYTQDITDLYGTYTETLSSFADKSVSSSGEIKLSVSDEALDLVSDFVGDLDLKWLNNICLRLDSTVDGPLNSAKLGLNISGKTILDLVSITDTDKGKVLFALSNLSDKYLETSVDIGELTVPTANQILSNKDVWAALPSKDVLNDLLNKYLELIVEQLTDVSKSSEMVKVGDIEQKLTALEIEVDMKDALNIAEVVLKEAKGDTNLKKIINDLADQAVELGFAEKDDADELYPEFKEFIEGLLEELDEAKEDIENETVLTLVDYVDASHKVVGRTLTVYEETYLDYVTVWDANDFATQLEVADIVSLSGSGSQEGDRKSGEYVLKVEGEEYAVINLDDFDTKKSDEGYLNGRITLEPAEALWEMINLDSSIASTVKMMELGLGFDFTSNADVATLSVNVLSKGKNFVGLSISVTEGSDDSVTMPSADKVLSEDEVYEWLQSLDFDKAINALREAGIPSDLVDLLESLLTAYAF